jgi:hypothetical protein
MAAAAGGCGRHKTHLVAPLAILAQLLQPRPIIPGVGRRR